MKVTIESECSVMFIRCNIGAYACRCLSSYGHYAYHTHCCGVVKETTMLHILSVVVLDSQQYLQSAPANLCECYTKEGRP